MTKREFYNAVISAKVSAKLTEFATKEIAKLDKVNSARSSKPTKTQRENEPIKNAILEYLTDKKPTTSPDIGSALNITTNKASGLARELVKEGKLIQSEVKIPKRGTLKAYAINPDYASEEKTQKIEEIVEETNT